MHAFQVHTIESAPEQAKPALKGLQQNIGLIPNLAATMAESPTLINGFVGAFANFHAGSFSNAERQALLLTNAVTNRCEWAVAFHSTLALQAGVSAEAVRAIREARAPEDARLAALSTLSRTLIEKRGHLSQDEQRAFADAGFEPARLLEVIAGVAVSAMANYAGNITRPPLEGPFQAQAWQAPERLPPG